MGHSQAYTPKLRVMGASRRDGLRNIRTSFPHYRQRTTVRKIPKADYFIIIGLFVRYLVKLIFQGYTVKLPEMGYMRIVKRKMEPRVSKDGRIVGLPINYKATNDYRKANPGSDHIIYHTNEHTSGYAFTLFWSKGKIYAENKDLYGFELSRGHKRASKEVIVGGMTDFDITYKDKMITHDVHVNRQDTFKVSERLWRGSGPE